jgi:predicted transglutaminase-like cysteine proteinase
MRKAFQIGALTALLISVSPFADEPFGVATVAAPNGPVSATWRGLQQGMQVDDRTVAACRSDPACGSAAALRLIAIVDEAMQYEGRARIGHINRAINQAILPAHEDVPWMSPLKAMALPGDCKSYAVTKYLALGNAGIAPEERRLVMVFDRAHPQETHLVVVVRVDSQWLILDNTTLTLIESTSKPTYEPLHTFDHSGVRDIPRAVPVS